MPISLPTCPMPTDYQVLLRDFGTILTPLLGGPDIRINRLGTRFGLRLDMPPMDVEDGGMAYVARLLQGRQSTVILPWPLLDFDPGDPGAPLVSAAVTSGTSLPIKGLSAGYQIKEGQFFSVIHAGRRYVYMFAAAGAANSSGVLTAQIYPLLRTPLSANDVIEIASPKIEGLVSPGDELSWSIGLDNARAFSFSIVEAA
jgi:hypothetical protein